MKHKRSALLTTPGEPVESFAESVAKALDRIRRDTGAIDQDRDRSLLMDDRTEQMEQHRTDVLDAVDAVELLNAALDRGPRSVEVTVYGESVTFLIQFHLSSVDGQDR